MEQQGEKKRWVVPELLVLVRSHPEEAVLTACKFFPPSSGALDFFSACAAISGCATTCEAGAPS